MWLCIALTVFSTAVRYAEDAVAFSTHDYGFAPLSALGRHLVVGVS